MKRKPKVDLVSLLKVIGELLPTILSFCGLKKKKTKSNNIKP